MLTPTANLPPTRRLPKMKITDMDAHPAARLFPMMDDVELRRLAEDIKKNGQLESVSIYGDLILDGRNRVAACKMLGINPVFTVVEGLLEARQSSPVQYVIAQNLHRRHLTPSQQTMIAVEMVPLLQEEARKRQEAGARIDTLAQDCAKGKVTAISAKAVGVSTRMVEMGVAVKKHNPELSEKVRAGEVKVNAAYKQVRESRRSVKELPTSQKRQPPDLLKWLKHEFNPSLQRVLVGYAKLAELPPEVWKEFEKRIEVITLRNNGSLIVKAHQKLFQTDGVHQRDSRSAAKTDQEEQRRTNLQMSGERSR